MSEAETPTGVFGPVDSKMEAKIAKKRQQEAERLQRIKDPKSRVMGIDTDALAIQVAEKQKAREMEKALAASYDAQRLNQDAQLALLEQERLRAIRQAAKNDDHFRKTQQGILKMREYDLNDPLALKKDLPARVGDDDGRLSVSGCQLFAGEDLAYAHRVKVQQQEIKSWMDEAIAMKAAKAAADKQMDDAFAQQAIEIDQMKTQLEATARSATSSSAVALAEYNFHLAAAKREREAAAQKAELQDNIAEIASNLSSDLLTENPSVGRSFIAPNRLRPDHYKGMAPDEQSDFRNALAVQTAQKAQAEAAAKAENADFDAAYEQARMQGCYQDALVATKRAEMRVKMAADNQKIAEQQFASQNFLKKEVFTNSIDASFYDNFGKTAR